MFPSRQNYPSRQGQRRRPLRHDPFLHPVSRISRNQQQSSSMTQNILSMFKTSEGNLDFEKITGTVQQLNKLYGEVRPMISRFIKR